MQDWGFNMPKVTLEFNLPEEREAFEDATKGSEYKWALEEVWDKVFRPRNKHLYGNDEINKIVESPDGEKLMDFLENIYRESVNKYE